MLRWFRDRSLLGLIRLCPKPFVYGTDFGDPLFPIKGRSRLPPKHIGIAGDKQCDVVRNSLEIRIRPQKFIQFSGCGLQFLTAVKILEQVFGQKRRKDHIVILLGQNETIQNAVSGNSKTGNRFRNGQKLPVCLAGLEGIYTRCGLSLMTLGYQGEGAVVEKCHYAAVTDMTDMELFSVIYSQCQRGIETEQELVHFQCLRLNRVPGQRKGLPDYLQYILVGWRLEVLQSGFTVRNRSLYRRPGSFVGQNAAAHTVRNGCDQILALLLFDETQPVGILTGNISCHMAGSLPGKTVAEYPRAKAAPAGGVAGSEGHRLPAGLIHVGIDGVWC